MPRQHQQMVGMQDVTMDASWHCRHGKTRSGHPPLHRTRVDLAGLLQRRSQHSRCAAISAESLCQTGPACSWTACCWQGGATSFAFEASQSRTLLRNSSTCRRTPALLALARPAAPSVTPLLCCLVRTAPSAPPPCWGLQLRRHRLSAWPSRPWGQPGLLLHWQRRVQRRLT